MRATYSGYIHDCEWVLDPVFQLILPVSEPCIISGRKWRRESELHRLHWISTVRLLHSPQPDHHYMSTVSFQMGIITVVWLKWCYRNTKSAVALVVLISITFLSREERYQMVVNQQSQQEREKKCTNGTYFKVRRHKVTWRSYLLVV